ncbi:MAG TPA: L-threonylcarbamoyladenylate synthase [Allosphingosinicella sp.]|jgi:L-threonylcarbamoyladenylate synthase
MSPQNQPVRTRVRRYGPAAIREAARLVLAGQPVAVPTETVYGLAADATDETAVARIYAAKGRPSFNPLIVHVLDLARAERIGHFSDAARRLAAEHWPGPLTLVVPLRRDSGIAPAVTAGLDTIALRCPAHRAMCDLLAASGRPLAAPSANASGGISPTSAEHVLNSLGGRIALIVDGGGTARGLESTIVKVEGDTLTLLRPGPLVLATTPPWKGGIEAPGMLASHYAPSKPLRLNAQRAEPDEWLIGFGAVQGDDTLSETGDLAEAAARLFAALHRAEAEAPGRIAVAPVPEEGIGEAINDRLRRAAAPREE